MNNIVVFSDKASPRLQYVLDWLLKEQLMLSYTLVTDEKELHELPFFISYGRHFLNALSIPAQGLLTQRGVAEHTLEIGSWYGIPTIYATGNTEYTLPFDLFSAIFFLLSRYEEYYPFTPDKHDRYPATDSILYKNGWLRRPLLDEWIQEFRIMLQKQFSIDIGTPTFSYLPTYDIDIAYAYRNKGFVRNAGAFIKDIVTLKGDVVKERMQVLLHQKKDPYDSFGWLQQLHRQRTKPVYFVLSALKTTDYDKNVPLSHPKMTSLIKRLCIKNKIGIHPSYYATNEGILKSEKRALEKTIGQNIRISRQHYIKVKLPQTYELLLTQGIIDDYSMGYGTHLGFRAGTGKAFLWYDHENEKTTTLRIHPFCFMDTTAMFEEKLSTEKAFERLDKMTKLLQQTNSRLITVFHNFSLGKSKEWSGWRNNYENFIEELYKSREETATNTHSL